MPRSCRAGADPIDLTRDDRSQERASEDSDGETTDDCPPEDEAVPAVQVPKHLAGAAASAYHMREAHFGPARCSTTALASHFCLSASMVQKVLSRSRHVEVRAGPCEQSRTSVAQETLSNNLQAVQRVREYYYQLINNGDDVTFVAVCAHFHSQCAPLHYERIRRILLRLTYNSLLAGPQERAARAAGLGVGGRAPHGQHALPLAGPPPPPRVPAVASAPLPGVAPAAPVAAARPSPSAPSAASAASCSTSTSTSPPSTVRSTLRSASADPRTGVAPMWSTVDAYGERVRVRAIREYYHLHTSTGAPVTFSQLAHRYHSNAAPLTVEYCRRIVSRESDDDVQAGEHELAAAVRARSEAQRGNRSQNQLPSAADPPPPAATAQTDQTACRN